MIDGWKGAVLGILETENRVKIVGAEGSGAEAVGAEPIEEVEADLLNNAVLLERSGPVISTHLENSENFQTVAQTRG